MKNKKLFYLIGGIILLLIIAITTVIIIVNKNSNITLKNNDDVQNNKDDSEPKSLLEAVLKNNKKTLEEAGYKKFVGGEVLNENTSFVEYAFISNNSIYIFDPQKLKSGELSYKKVYDIQSDIKVMNIRPSLGADISFVDYTDTAYELRDDNIDNVGPYDYSLFENATYKLGKMYGESLSMIYQKQKLDYDFISNYFYIKDNILYTYGAGVDYKIDKISGNYEGEKLIRIYNERILKTDKGFYEIIKYYGENYKGTYTATMKIDLLSKYYDDVLTFTYEYVILKDYTMIPINDVMPNRPQKYQYNYYWGTLNEPPESFVE